MARYTGPRVRISRRFGVPIFGPTKYLERRNYGPGVHGPKSRRKHTDYGLGLIEKQKLRYYYGLLERQFRGVYERALRRRGVTGEKMLQILETRLDNVVYHLGFANTRAGARQMVGHGHVRVNGRKVNIPSYALKVNDVIEVKNSNVVAPDGHQESRNRHQPRGAGLAVAEQGSVQGRGDAHPDPRRDPADRQRAGGRRILFPLSQSNRVPEACVAGCPKQLYGPVRPAGIAAGRARLKL